MRPLHALIVEDSSDDAEMLRRELNRGYELISQRVQTAADMRRMLDDFEWDIIFSDWSMPQFSATAALDIVHQRNLDIPFIIISGTIGEEAAVAALRRG